MSFDRILQGLTATSPRPHSPQFHVERDRWGWRIFDDDAAIAHFMNRGGFCFDIWKFSPFEAEEMAHTEPPTDVYDLHTVHNTVINFPYYTARDVVGDGETQFERMQQRWITDAGPELHLRIAGEFAEGQRLQYDCRFIYDPAWARYRFFLEANFWKVESCGAEPINMMLAGALEDTAEKRRWTHSIWADPHGKLKRLVHSNALFTATDYGDDCGRGRTKNAPLRGAWIAYAAHPTFNPCMLVHEANVPVHFATCSQLFDEHLIWQNAGLDELDENLFHFVMKTEFVNLPADLAQRFLDEAADPPQPKRWRKETIALPFRVGEVNSFEETLDPWLPEDCPVLALDNRDEWSDSEAHSGSHSVRLVGQSFHSWQRRFPSGAVCMVEPESCYRLSGWIKTRAVERFARLELFTYEYTYPNIIDFARSIHVAGDSDWTRVEVELATGSEAYIMPQLALYGEGAAWFDDVKLDKV